MREVRQSAQLALWQGDLPRARSLVREGLSLAARDPDGPWVWTFRFLDAEVLLAERRFPDVLALVSASIPGGRALDPARAHQRYLEARSLAAQGRLPDALAALDRARPEAPGDLRLDVDILEGQLRLQLGQWPQGEAALASVVERALAAGDRYRQAVAFANLGMGQFTRGRHEDALFWFERVLSFRELEHYTVYATALSNAGICYTRLGEFDRALATERRAFEIHERRGPRIYFVQALGQLGNLYLLRGDAAEGLPYLRRALEVAIEAGLDADAALWAGNLASALVDLGQWDEAERLNAEARRLGAASRSSKPAYHTLNAARIALGRGDLAAARRLFGEASGPAGAPGSSADGPGPDVRWSAEYGLARVALAERQDGRARRHFEAALDTIEQSRSDLLRTEYRLSYLTQLIRFYRAYVDALIAQGDVERALEIADSSRGRVLAERHGVEAAARAGAGTFTRIASGTSTRAPPGRLPGSPPGRLPRSPPARVRCSCSTGSARSGPTCGR